MTDSQTSNEPLDFRRLTAIKEEHSQHILQLLLVANTNFEESLWQVLDATNDEITRLLRNETGTLVDYQRVATNYAMAVLLSTEHIKNLDQRNRDGIRWSKRERLLSRLLNQVLWVLDVAVDAYKSHFPTADIKKDFAQHFYKEFCHLTLQEAEQAAREIISGFFSIEGLAA